MRTKLIYGQNVDGVVMVASREPSTPPWVGAIRPVKDQQFCATSALYAWPYELGEYDSVEEAREALVLHAENVLARRSHLRRAPQLGISAEERDALHADPTVML